MSVEAEVEEPSAFDLVGSELEIATGDLFADYEGTTQIEEAPELSGAFAFASIGFTSEGMGGCVSLLASVPCVRILQRTFMDEDDDSLLDSTIGEYSNMLLGRLKNRLLAKGIVFKMATPIASIGSAVRLVLPAPGTHSRWLRFAGKTVTVDVRVDVAFEPGFDASGEQGTAAIAEGSVLVFDSERKAA